MLSQLFIALVTLGWLGSRCSAVTADLIQLRTTSGGFGITGTDGRGAVGVTAMTVSPVGAFLLDFHSGEFCGLRIYWLALEFVDLPPVESIFRDSQQPLGDVHALPCFLLCLGPSLSLSSQDVAPSAVIQDSLIQHANQLLFSVEQVESHECHWFEVRCVAEIGDVRIGRFVECRSGG
jgi:hypothetical protein